MLAANLSITSVASVCGALNRPVLFLDMLGAVLDPRITFTRASSGTHFDSTGRLVVDANDVARFDYDPATPAGTVGPELMTASVVTGSWAYIQPTSGAVSVTNGITRVYSADGTLAQFQENGTVSVTIGNTYAITFTLLVAAGTCLVQDVFTTQIGSYATSGTYTVYAKSTGASPLFLIKRQSGVTDFTVSNISVREVTFTPRDLLIEAAATNLLLHSRDMTQAAWSKTDVTAARTQVGIDGAANTACLMTEGSAGTAAVGQGGAVSAGATITGSTVLKRGNTDWVRFLVCGPGATNGANGYFNLATGAVGATSAVGTGTAITSSITNLGGGWYRCSLTCIPDGAYTTGNLFIQSATANSNPTRVANSTYIVDCAQLEVGAFASPSVITTGAATATRALDVNSSTAVMVGAAGTVVIEAIAPPLIGTRVLYSLDDGTSSNQIVIYLNTGGVITCLWKVGGVAQAAINTTAVTAGATLKLAFAWALNDFAVSLNGATVLTDTLGTVPTVTTRRIGMEVGNNNQWNSQIRALREYSTRLPDATLRALST